MFLKNKLTGAWRRHTAWLAALLLLVGGTALINASGEVSAGKQAPYWKRSLPSSTCPNSSNTNCHRASPVLADISGDGKLEIIVATNRGHVLAYRHDGALLWDRDVAAAFGMSSNRQRIASSPAVADVDADGRMEIVVGAGTIHRSICTQGGVIVLEDNGAVKSGWPYLMSDYNIPPKGCRESVFSTPALGDLDKDGDLEIVFGSFDKRIYALHHNGQALTGFPARSHLFERFRWENLKNRLADTIWSSPALADLDGDGYLDIIIGTDEGNFDNTWEPVLGNWQCPYRKVYTQGYCGGAIYGLDRFGKSLPGFPRYELEIIQSSPSTLDINGDGRYEFFVGGGDHYFENSPDHPTYGFRLLGIGGDGKDLPGWAGGKKLGGVISASPAIGDLDGDGSPEVVVPARDKKLYAFHLNGQPVNGFPMQPRMNDGQVLDSYRTGTSPILADYTGNGKMEIFLRHAWETIIVDGSGQQLTARGNGDSKPAYVTNGPLWNNPAVGDLDGDGRMELVSQNSELIVWKLPNISTRADWPMFKQNAERNSSVTPQFTSAPDSLHIVHEKGDLRRYTQRLNITSYLGTFDWELGTENPDVIKFPQSNGSVSGQRMIDVNVFASRELPIGKNKVGTIHLTISQNGNVYSRINIPVEIAVFANLEQAYLPFLH